MLKNIFAVVVSYNGGPDIVETVLSIVEETSFVYIIDNFSDDYNKKVLLELSQHKKVEIVFLSENVGIGSALNMAINKAKLHGSNWLLTMDQDSVFLPGFIDAFIQCKELFPEAHVMTPNIDNSSKSKSIYNVEYAITSGNLINLRVFNEIGVYNEWLFIDGVDFDFSLRLRLAGFKIYSVPNAHLKHKLGDMDTKYFKRFHSYHSPLRRYYIFRNHFYLMSLFLSKYPILILKMSLSRFIYLFTIFVFGKQRLRSFLYIILGFYHFLRRKKGKF